MDEFVLEKYVFPFSDLFPICLEQLLGRGQTKNKTYQWESEDESGLKSERIYNPNFNNKSIEPNH